MRAPDPGYVDGAEFRAAMRHPASAVAIIAAGARGARTGLTATSVCSLSDAPPSVLVCVNRGTYSFGVIQETRAFSINFLHVEQVELAKLFAGRTPQFGEQRFDDSLWMTAITGAPVLRQCLAAFDCRLVDEYQRATHTIFIGAVASIHDTHGYSGLVYSRGEFSRTAPID
jgi:flavin reductase (NADH)/cob(II)yrinic acid a,c-diamide reductase